ncbi:hypothetical protein EVAR_36801_1 [Eumeta japonica]|uniref:Reverse transcriptase domain-containing protein n=1 Tax=Eumeta variegata TaxID=151549 RepID=A0A4C1WUW2_EUMVA|nr:hypothetical protein EVAR_36801_1 [Eumeta japonica]
MDDLSVKFLLYADDQVILAPSACGLSVMVNKINDSVKKRSMKLDLVRIRNVPSKKSVLERRTRTEDCREPDFDELAGRRGREATAAIIDISTRYQYSFTVCVTR